MTCDQAQWQAITYYEDDREQYLATLPASYSEPIEEGNKRIYLACFCPMLHRFINYWPMFCDGNIPGEAKNFKDYIENKG